MRRSRKILSKNKKKQQKSRTPSRRPGELSSPSNFPFDSKSVLSDSHPSDSDFISLHFSPSLICKLDFDQTHREYGV